MKLSLWLVVCLLGINACQVLPSLGPAPAASATPHPTIPLPPTQTATARPATVMPPPADLRPTPTAMPAGPLLLAPRTLVDSGSKPPYTFNVQYPQLDSAGAPGLQAFNRYAEKFARDLLASYQKVLQQFPATPDPLTGSTFMDAKYQVNNGIHGLLSIQFTIYSYMAGAAHPNSYTQVINYDLKRGKNFELQDVFLPGASYLPALADYCRSDLKKRDRLEFPEGLMPKAENFSNWNFTNQGLVIFFDPYQVASYAMGPSQVLIPYSALRGLLNPAGPLGVFIIG